jgi:hypothetical protein
VVGVSSMAEPVEEKKQSFLFKAKKKFASEIGDTKMGRKAILKFVGEEGEKVVETVSDLADLESGGTKGSEIAKDVLKLSMKGMLMADEGILTRENTFHAMDPINFLAKKVLIACEKTPEEIKENHELIPSLLANFSRVKDIIVQLVENNMKEKNVQKLKDLFVYVGSKSFIECLLLNPEADEHKKQIAASLRLLLKAQLEEEEFLAKQAASKA